MRSTTIIIFISFILIVKITKSQTTGIGMSGIYNFQAEGMGMGIRGVIFPDNKLSIVPQISYFFPFNKVTEYTIGLGLHYNFVEINYLKFYAMAHSGYNNWLNYKSSPLKDAKANNWNLEGGLGISTTTCLRPFLEYRYNVKFKETHLNIGVIYIFGCVGNKYISEDACKNF